MVKQKEQSSRREAMRQRQRQQKTRSRIIFYAIAAVLVGFVGLFFWNVFQPPAGVEVEIMEDFGHVEPGTVVDYNTNPPTSGPHYAQTLYAGFFDESSQESQIPNVESHIVHNLEHGYVVVWYNCSSLDGDACATLKDEIRAVLADVGETKVIVFPWNSMDEVVVLTSWGMELRMMDDFNSSTASRFIKTNRSHPRAPESLAQ